MPSIGVAGRLRLARTHGIDGGVTARGCRLLEHLCDRGRARAALLGVLGRGIDLVVGHRVCRRYLKLKGCLSAQVLPVALYANLRLGGWHGVNGTVSCDGGPSDGERIVARQQLNTATVLINIERLAHGGAVRVLPAHLHGNLGAGGTVEPCGMYANLHRHHGVGVDGSDGGLFLLVSVPSGIARAAGNERGGNDAGNHQIASLGRHLVMASLGFACRGNGRQGNIAHGDGLVDGRRRTQARKLAGERVIGRQAAKQGGLFSRGGFRLDVVLAIVLFGFGLVRSVFGVAAFVLSAFAHLVLRVDGQIAQRELV